MKSQLVNFQRQDEQNLRKKQQKLTQQRSEKYKMSLLALDQQQVKALKLMKRMEQRKGFFKKSRGQVCSE